MNYTYLETPIGTLLIAGDSESLRRISFPKKDRPAKPQPGWQESSRGAVAEAAQQLREYFSKRRTSFDLPLAPEGTAFQRSVWRALQEIPFGETASYGDIARRIGKPNAARAVGSANHVNPLPIVIPCHRVIGSNGTLTGFGGGLLVKQALLDLEAGALISNRAAVGR